MARMIDADRLLLVLSEYPGTISDLALATVVHSIERELRVTKGSLPKEDKRKHEATHGWRNPPSVYEEDRSET